MDAFPFLSHKKQQEECRDTLSVVSDVATLLTLLTTEDRAKMLQRRDPQIANQQVREAVLRRASRIGLLLEDIDGCTGSSLQSTHGKEWDSFLSGGGPPLPSPALLSALEEVSRSLRVRRDQYATLEQDDGSSSYSDYSDSRSVSSSSSSSSRTDSEEETSEEEEEDRAARQRTTGRKGAPPAPQAARQGGAGSRPPSPAALAQKKKGRLVLAHRRVHPHLLPHNRPSLA